MATREALKAVRRLEQVKAALCDMLPRLGQPGYAGSRGLVMSLIAAAIRVGEVRERRPASVDDIARYLILNGKGWHDPDGPTEVDGIDDDEGAGYPVKYHWESGGAGADSVQGFIRGNSLPIAEACRLFAAMLEADRADRSPPREEAPACTLCMACNGTGRGGYYDPSSMLVPKPDCQYCRGTGRSHRPAPGGKPGEESK